jgi:NAD(P)-dependent dehydrogenase (short-subunit alcohol dehydrogenase family)
MSSNPEVLAQAEHLKGKVVAVTCATSPLGEALCEHAAKAGASVFALDSDPTALAQQSISFRQNKLRLRPMPCDFTSQESILNAVQEIVSHAPPIDFWIHAEALAPADLHRLLPAMHVFGLHFDMRGKGKFLLLGANAKPDDLEKAISDALPIETFTEKAKIEVFIPTETSPSLIASAAITRLA